MKKWMIALISGIAVLAVAITAWAIWFCSPGIHLFWRFAHFNLDSRDCYIIDPESGKVLEQTSLSTKGSYVDIGKEGDSRMLDVSFEIQGYTNLTEQEGSYNLVGGMEDDGWVILYTEVMKELNPETSAWEDVKDTQIYGIIRTDVGGDKDLLVQLSYFNGQPSVYAICADSQEEALEIYQEFQKG